MLERKKKRPVIARPDAERRSSPRVTVNIAADFKVTYVYYTGQVLNVSRTGMFLTTNNPFPEGTEIHITLHMPEDERKISLSGVVIWTRFKSSETLPAGMGIKIQGTNKRDMGFLIKYISKLQKYSR